MVPATHGQLSNPNPYPTITITITITISITTTLTITLTLTQEPMANCAGEWAYDPSPQLYDCTQLASPSARIWRGMCGAMLTHVRPGASCTTSTCAGRT